MALTLTLVVPAVVAVWLLAAGRGYAPSTARGLALLASVVTFLLTDVDHGWPSETWGLDTNEAVLRFFARMLRGLTP